MKKVLFFLAIICFAVSLQTGLKHSIFTSNFFQHSIFVIKDVKYRTNKKILDFNITIWNNDGIQPFSVNLTFTSFANISKMVFTIAVKIPKSLTDKNFEREFVRASVDVEKVLKGINNNFVTGLVFKNIMESVDGQLIFPVPKVTLIFTPDQIFRFASFPFLWLYFSVCVWLTQHFKSNNQNFDKEIWYFIPNVKLTISFWFLGHLPVYQRVIRRFFHSA